MKKMLLAVVMGMTFAGSAFAGAGFYLGAEGGFVSFKNGADDMADLYVNDYGTNSAHAEQDTSALAFRPFVGADLTENIGLEFGVMAFSQETTVTGNYSGGHYKESYDLSWRTIDFSAMLRPSAESGLHGLFARLGGHSTTATVDFKSSLGGKDSSSKTDSGILFGLGYDWFLGKNKDHHALRFSFTHYSNFVAGSKGKDYSDFIGLEDDALNILRIGYFYKF